MTDSVQGPELPETERLKLLRASIEESRKARASATWAARKTAETKAWSDNIQNITSEAFGLLRKFVEVGISNPVVGAASAMMLADMLQRANLISANTEACVFGVALATVGVNLGSAIATDVTSIIDAIDPFDMFKNPPSASADNLAPVAQVVVLGGGDGEKVAKALAGLAIPEARYVEGKGF